MDQARVEIRAGVAPPDPSYVRPLILPPNALTTPAFWTVELPGQASRVGGGGGGGGAMVHWFAEPLVEPAVAAKLPVPSGQRPYVIAADVVHAVEAVGTGDVQVARRGEAR